MYRNTAGQVIGAQMVSASDGSAFTGSVTVYVTGDGGTQAVGSVGSGACTHEGNGFHSYAPAQAETDYSHVAFTFVGTGAVPVTVQVYPVELNNYADALLKRDMSAVTGEAARSPLNAFRYLRNKWSIAAGNLTVTKEDDTTVAWTATLTTSASAEAVTALDPG